MISIKTLTKNNNQNFNLFTEETVEKGIKEFPEITDFFKGKKDEFFVKVTENKIDFLIGIGKENQLKDTDFYEIAKKFSNEFRDKFKKIPTSILGDFSQNQIKEFVTGLFSGTYNYPFDKEHPFWNEDFEINLKGFENDTLEELSIKVEALCYGQFAAMEWMNKPPNQKTAKQLTFFLAEESRKLKIKFKQLNKAECEQEGMGAYLAVNSASAQDAAFTVLEYNCGVENSKTIGLVGKCVLFDTGGISIKPAQNMHYMKSDMGGAAAVFGALFTVAKLKLPVNLVAVLPITDNVISNQACLPGDVVRAGNGKTIEILNTDAEGRLTLADGLAYITKHYQTDILLDLATLTGSAVRMFGTTCAPYFSNQPELRAQIEKSAEKSGELVWNLPLWKIWEDDISSGVADLKNISMKPYGDCIVAAKFLEQFTDNHPAWAHFDIAGMAFGDVIYSKEKAATAYGVRLLYDFISNF